MTGRPTGLNVRKQIEYFVSWLLCIDPQPVLAILGSFTLTYGIFLLSPWIDTFGSVTLYDTMHVMADEWVWGAAMTVIGAGQVFHAFRRPGRGATASSFAGLIIWSLVVAGMLVSARLTTAIPVYGWIVAWHGWLFYRMRGASAHGGR